MRPEPKQKFDDLFPGTRPFDSPSFESPLVRNIQQGRCWGCKQKCSWLTYIWNQKPVPICSIECFEYLDEIYSFNPSEVP